MHRCRQFLAMHHEAAISRQRHRPPPGTRERRPDRGRQPIPHRPAFRPQQRATPAMRQEPLRPQRIRPGPHGDDGIILQPPAQPAVDGGQIDRTRTGNPPRPRLAFPPRRLRPDPPPGGNRRQPGQRRGHRRCAGLHRHIGLIHPVQLVAIGMGMDQALHRPRRPQQREPAKLPADGVQLAQPRAHHQQQVARRHPVAQRGIDADADFPHKPRIGVVE